MAKTSKPPANAGAKQARGRFAKGVSGNPAGKPKETRHKITQAAEVLLDAQADALTHKAVAMALGGDPQAMRMCLDRILPPRKTRPIKFDMPAVETTSDLVAALGSVIAAVATGKLTPDEGSAVAGLIETKRKAIEVSELDARLTALERAKEERR